MSHNNITDLKEKAAQLRKPSGALGLTIADLMNKGNALMSTTTYDKLDVQEHEAILEIGMGNGLFVPYLMDKAPNMNYTGLDYSELMVKTASEKNFKAVEAGNVSFVHGSIENLPFAPGSFNKICTSNTLYFWPNPQRVMDGLLAVLKEGGKLLIAIRPQDVMNNLPVTEYNFIRYTEEEAKDMMETSGFKNVVIETLEEPDRIIEEEHFKLRSSYIIGEKPRT